MTDTKKGKGFLPPDAHRFAKQMGIDLDGLEPEAREIWNQLNTLSMENPIEYQRFVSDQMQLAKEESEGKSSDLKRSFRPEAAFSVETHSFGGDGMKIRDEFATPKLFVNFCSSILIEEPKDKFGKVMDINMETADGLQIPLIIGKVRKLSDGNAVDIVFSPNVISHSNHHRYFKQQIIELGLQWLEQETELKFEKKNVKENETCKYIGGLGENKDIPVLFYIDEEMIRPPDERIQKHDNKSQNKNNVQKEGFLSSTKSLLTQLEKEKDELLSSGTETRLPFQEVAKKPMIEEVGVASNDDIYKAAKNAVSFEEDTTVKGANQKHTVQQAQKPPTKLEYQKFMDVYQRFDRDIGSSLSLDFPWGEDEHASMLLQDLAKALAVTDQAKTSSHPPKAPTVGTELSDDEAIIITNPSPNVVRVGAMFGKDDSGHGWSLKVILEDLSVNARASAIDILVSPNEVKIRSPLNCFEKGRHLEGDILISASYGGQRLTLNSARTSASFKKKAGKLVIMIGCDIRKSK